MATQPPANKISSAKSRLLIDHPFFASLLIRTPVVITDKTDYGAPVRLAATDGTNIYYNPDFLDQCSVEDVMTVLAHEVGHDSLLHSLRMGNRNPSLSNQAMDHAINLMLVDQKFQCPEVLNGGWLADQQYKGFNWERIYDDLKRKQPPPDKGGKKKGNKGGNGAPPPPGAGHGADPDDAGTNGHDALHGDVLRGPPKDANQQAEAEQKAKQRVAAAATMARMAGKLTGELERMVGEFLNPKVHWTSVLREYMTRIVKARDNWGRRNRRFAGMYLPTRRSNLMGPIIFIPDTSGSMWGEDMEKICSEMAHCAREVNPENIRVIWADTDVKGEQVFDVSEFEFKALVPKGGGGTDMRTPLEYVKRYDPQIVVLMTDCETPWPREPMPYPVICISTTKASCPDWMERIDI